MAMTKQLGGLIGITVACAMTASAASTYTFTSPEGRFTAEFPAAPALERTKGNATGGIPYDRYQWSIENKDGWWAVSMFIYSKAVPRDYDANTRGAVVATKGNLVSQKSIVQNGAEGREILIDVPQSGMVRLRFLWIGERFYQVVFSGKPGTGATPDVDAFLDSFRIVN
jgi:hypothetical protein